MNKILVGINKSFKWTVSDNIFVIGMAFFGEKLLQNQDLATYFRGCSEKWDFINRVKNLNGFYSIIVNLDGLTMIASDRIRSFPLFYKKNISNYLITDDLRSISNKKIEERSKEEFLATGYVTNHYTLFKDIYQTENGTCLFIDENYEVNTVKYFDYKYKLDYSFAESKDVFEKINTVHEIVIKRLIKFLNGRKAVIPLSGGHDSRVIAYYLNKFGYRNVVTYTYGMQDNQEAAVSKLVAEHLGFKWYFVPYENKDMQEMYNTSKYEEVADYCGNGYSVPHIQEWRAVDFLFKEGIIDQDCIVIPGFTGDFLTGGHIPGSLFNKKDVSMAQLKDLILKEHYKLYDWGKLKKLHRNYFDNRIYRSINVKKVNNDISGEEAVNLLEKFDFQERQVKFISNAVRIYEHYGLKWYMPFWDVDLIDFWLTVPIKHKYNRSLFEEFTENEYKALMDYAPIYQVKYNKVYENIFINNLAKISRIYSTYYRHFINYYGYLKFTHYLLYVAKYQTSSYYFMFSHKYISHIQQKSDN